MNANAPHLDIDHTIDRALTALRDAQPRSGLNSRILASLDHRTDTVGGPSFRALKGWGIVRGTARRNGVTAHLALWAATSAAVIAIASLAILHYSAPTKNPVILSEATRTDANKNPVILSEASHTDANKNPVILSEASRTDANKNPVILSEARSAEPKNPETARLTTNSKPFSTTDLARTTHTAVSTANLAQATPTLSSRPEHRSLAAMRSGETCISDHHEPGCPIHDHGPAVVMGGLTTTSTDAQALADLHAPSHPAPPLPLTRQERLFLHVLRYGNATQLAELNPAIRAQRDADETTAFKAFFPDPPPLDQSNGDNE